ncbi:DUF4157 domain-containing protein [Chitinophaga filiformis]|uniref:eCIS core domain-containing protein n=1 Tax=Chitinophaga filiformis TaxID=104663 RepID=UPI001F436E51|nr:DUF4157 domain-containing protein [Chitinophaga filiformis]MCF6407758.1 DUF4157 domain-containing protein [Chitinophaga filiformis]
MTTATFKAGYKAKPVTRGPVIQPKLSVNRPGDAYEQEADAMANRVMQLSGKPAAGVTSNALIGPSIQRKCEHCEEEEKKKSLMRKTESTSGGFAASPELASRLGSSKGGGMPLSANTRSFMENAFSRDFSQVRVHADSEAHNMSDSIQARAFTHGNDVYFKSGQYQPGTAEGQRLLAHELTHVAQQEGGRTSQLQRSIELRAPGRGEASAFDRAGELVDRLNQQHPEAITYSLDGNILRCEVLDEGALTHFDSEMRRFIENEERVIPLRLITRHGLARGGEGGPFEPVVLDHYDSGYVDLDDLLASEGFAFQSNLIHFLTERFVTSNYARRLGTRFSDAEFDRAHAAGQQAEAAVFRSIFDDPSIRFASQDNLPNGGAQVVFFSRAERYTIFMFLRSPGDRTLTRSTVRVRTADRRRTLTVDEFLEERRRARAAAAPAPVVQPKLEVNTPGDRYEREADAMAERVMRMSASRTPILHTQALMGPSVQRKCAQCEEEQKKVGVMRKAEGGGGLQATPALGAKLAANKGGGSPLPDGTRRFMENAFSADFSRVSIHNNSEAAAMSQSIQAHAFTHGNDIYFNSGRYSPHTQQGQHLLAHELTHTLQQTGGIHRSTGTDASSGGSNPASGATGTSGATTTGAGAAGATGGISVDVLAAVDPDGFFVKAAAQELGTDIRVSSLENMIDKLEAIVPEKGCLANLNIYNHGSPRIQMVAGNNKVKNPDGTTGRTSTEGFTLQWLQLGANQTALNRLRHLFCCNGTMNWRGCSTVGVKASGGKSRTPQEVAASPLRYGDYPDIYQSIPEALMRGAFKKLEDIGAVNAQSWADATCTNIKGSNDFTYWAMRDGKMAGITGHGGKTIEYRPRAAAACTCDETSKRVSGPAPTAAEITRSAAEIRDTELSSSYEKYRSVIGNEPLPPVQTPEQVKEKEKQAEESRKLGEQIRKAILDRMTGGKAPANAAEALQIAGTWGVTMQKILKKLGGISTATGSAVTNASAEVEGPAAQQRRLEAALTPAGRETFMKMLVKVQQEPFWAKHFANTTIYVFPDLAADSPYRGFTQHGTRTMTDDSGVDRSAPLHIIHMKKDMFDKGEFEWAAASLVHELSHTIFENITGRAMEGFHKELAQLIADDPQIVALRGSSATAADREKQVKDISQLLYNASAYAEEEVFVHLQQLTHQPDVGAVPGPDYIKERVTIYLKNLFRMKLPTPVLREVIKNLASQTRILYQARIAALPARSRERLDMEYNLEMAKLTLRLAYDEVTNPTPATP